MLNISKIKEYYTRNGKLNIDMLGVSKVKLSGNGDLWLNDYCIIYSDGETLGSLGVEFIMNKKWGP